MYRDDDAAVRAELVELESELARARTERDELVRRLEPLQAEQDRIRRLQHRAWRILFFVVPLIVFVVPAHLAFRSGKPETNTLDPEARRLRDELAEAQAEARRLLNEIREARVDGGKSVHMLGVLDAMRSLNAQDEQDAWRIVEGAACMRGDPELLARARQETGDAGWTSVSQACTVLADGRP